uniref:Uncharacterized protein n=1 Tax=Rhizophora mucronata TaxID=61149 RepID=A0A2P2NQY2_RHIMU
MSDPIWKTSHTKKEILLIFLSSLFFFC